MKGTLMTPRLIWTVPAVVAALVTTTAAAADRTPPTAPYILYSSGLCWAAGPFPLTIGIQRSTDDTTSQPALTYEVFADGTRIGTLHDTGTEAAVWGTLHFSHGGDQTVTAKAVDAAGNRSRPSNANVITTYHC
jgi:hypothetical protein